MSWNNSTINHKLLRFFFSVLGYVLSWVLSFLGSSGLQWLKNMIWNPWNLRKIALQPPPSVVRFQTLWFSQTQFLRTETSEIIVRRVWEGPVLLELKNALQRFATFWGDYSGKSCFRWRFSLISLFFSTLQMKNLIFLKIFRKFKKCFPETPTKCNRKTL